MTSATARPMPGGPLSVDLLNTRWMSDQGWVDWLDDDSAVQSFATAHDVEVAAGNVAAVRTELVYVRELLARFFHASAEGLVDESLATEISNVLASAQLSYSAAEQELVVASTASAKKLAVDAVVDAVNLAKARPGRVRSCDNDSCVLWFDDTSKSGRRRWCSMERCGNRAKAKRHHERSKDTA